MTTKTATAPTATLDLYAIQSPRYSENAARAGDRLPCCICGKGIQPEHEAGWVHIHAGGAKIVTLAERERLNANGEEGADMGAYPVGRECLRRHPELKAYF